MAVRFDADNEFYTRTVSSSGNNWTMCGWGKVSTDRNDFSTFFGWSDGTTTNRAFLQTAADGTQLTWWGPGGNQAIGVLTVGTWYFMGVRVSGTTVNCYVRALDGTGGWTYTLSGTGQASWALTAIRLGASIQTGNEWLNGCVSGVKFWNATLTEQELWDEQWQHLPSRTANLVGWWPLLTPETTDYSGRAQTLSGGSGTAQEQGPGIPWSSDSFGDFPNPFPGYQRTLTIDQTKVDADLTNFPVTVKLTSSNFDFTKTGGNDIRFYASDGTTALTFERERYDASSQIGVFHVLLPSVSGSVDTTFKMRYGDGAADTADTSGAVWDADFVGVYHLNEEPSNVTHVGTGAAVHGTTSATPTYPAGYTATAGDRAIVIAVTGSSTAATPTIGGTGWSTPSGGSVSGGDGSFGAGTGPRRITVFTKDVTAGMTLDAVSMTGTTPSVSVTCMIVRKSAGGSYTITTSSGSDTTAGTGYSAATGTALDIRASDLLVGIIGTNDALTNGSGFSAHSLTATGGTFNSITERLDASTANGNDQSICVFTTEATQGKTTAAATIAATLSASSSGPAMLLQIRAAGDVTDASGTGNHGSALGFASTAEEAAQIGLGLHFDGTNDHIDLPTFGSLAAVTVEAWINPDSNAVAHQGIVSQDNFSAGDVHFKNNAGTLSAQAQGQTAVNNGTLTTGTWYYTAYTFAVSGSLVLWRDLTAASPTGAGATNWDGSAIEIGHEFTSYASAARFFDGLIDEVRISDVVRSDAWIIASSHSGAGTLLTVGSEGPPGGPSEVNLTPATMTLSGVTLSAVPGAVTVNLTPATATLTGVAVNPVPQPVTVNLTPASATLTAVAVTAVPQPVTVALTPAALSLAGVSLTAVPGVVTTSLTPAAATLTAVALDPVPQPVVVSLTPASLTLTAIVVSATSPSSVSLTVAGVTLAAVALDPVPQPVTVSLTPAALSLAAQAVTAVPGAVTVALTPAALTLTAIEVDPEPIPGEATLTVAGLTLTAVALNPVPGAVTVNLTPAGVALTAIAVDPDPIPVEVALAAAGLSLVGVPLTAQPLPVSVALTPANVTFTALGLGAGGVGTANLTPAVLGLTAVLLDPVPGAVAVALTPAGLNLTAVQLTAAPVGAATLLPASVTLTAPVLTPIPGAVTVGLTPAGLSFEAVRLLFAEPGIANLVPAMILVQAGLLVPAGTTGHRESELDHQIINTKAFIDANPVWLTLVPHTREKTGTGTRYIPGTPRPMQKLRLIDQSSTSGPQPGAVAGSDGIQRRVEYQMLGLPDAEIGKYDRWQDAHGIWWEVADLLPDNGYERRAQVVRYGQS